MKAIIVSGGRAPSKQLLLNEIKNSNLIIGADKGCEVLYNYNISPNYILGDFDSADKDIIKAMEVSGCEKIKYKKEKDFTDTEIAFNLAVEKGAKEIVLLGGTGTRYDHSLSNLGLMLKALKMSIILKIIDDNNIIFLTDKSIILKGNKGDTISFHAYCECVKKLNICGSKYDLINYDLYLGDGLTTSNEFIGNDIKITFDSGILMVLYTKD
ncbi:MAG: thiamine diphosphokinase [Clostridium sp.]|uniref:thiamine diphosphokinase n=1 Tax=Clostridium sp. TaxID=1506 RepID=UPI001ECE1F75|nr:thiamine diphosphokinase [Clostridium sp.]MBS5883416.1 thiamine diphosphokinase [Clostridium sp.]MDU7147040.1 thiamine diphosphokinase [Clostridium sp.]MDU7240136.1 thiamine diphosphokinase [Clostridium sp.]